MLSKENRTRVSKGENLVVDDEWIKAFPEDAAFKGQTIPIQETSLTPLKDKNKEVEFHHDLAS